MNTKTKKVRLCVILVFACLLIAEIILLMVAPSHSEPRLTISYADSSNVNGIKVQRFTISNKGTASAVHSGAGGYEVKSSERGVPHFYPVGYTFQRRRIRPGETQTIEVKVPALPDVDLRLMCFFAHDTLRVTVNDWQWGPNGPGAKANWLVPQFLRGKPIDIRATSVWLSEYVLP
jgi:hypothetical protein